MLFEQTSFTIEEVENLKEPFTVTGTEYWDITSMDGTKWTFDHVEQCYTRLYKEGEEEITVKEMETILACTTPEQQEALGITIVTLSDTPPDPFDNMSGNVS